MGTVNDSPNATPGDAGWRPRRYICGRSLFVPLLLITMGVVFLLSQYHFIAAHRAWEFIWPFVFIFFGVNLLGRGRSGLGAVFVVLGVAMIGAPLGLWHYDLSRLWPVILILLGISMLTGGWERRRYWRERRYRRWRDGDWQSFSAAAPGSAAGGSGDDAGKLDADAVLGGFQRRIAAQNFSGGRINAVMGGFQLDLRQAQIAGETAVLDIAAVFGGGEITVPTSWIIDMRGQGLFGGYSDETHQDPPAPGSKRLIIQGTTFFGGVVVKN